MDNRKIKKTTERDIRCYAEIQKSGDMVHKMDTDNYCEASVLLSSDDYEQLHEAVLVTENFLTTGRGIFKEKIFHPKTNMRVKFILNGMDLQAHMEI